MALTNYADLQASVAGWLHRTDMGTIIPDLIALAEKRINGDLDARLQDTVVTLSTVNSGQFISIPSDVINIRSLTIQSNPNQVLNYLTPDQFNTQYAAASSGVPRSFTVIGSSITLGPVPDAVYPIQCIYKASVPVLSMSGTNWLMTNYPQVYLMATLCQSVMYTRDMASLSAWEQQYKEAIQSVNAVDWYSGSSMRVRQDVRQ